MIYNWLREHGHAAIKVVSNLPYNISTPVVINLLENDLPISEMVLMLQQEITDRMTALPGTREYGMLSVIIRLFSEVEVVKSLPPEVFWPKPSVHSAIVKVRVQKEKYAGRITDYPFFRQIINAIFTSRRKTLINSLERLNVPGISREHLKQVLKDMRLDERIRGETLDVDQLIHLSEAIGKQKPF